MEQLFLFVAFPAICLPKPTELPILRIINPVTQENGQVFTPGDLVFLT